MRFIRKEDGQGLVEYALLLVLIAVVVIAILSLLGPRIRSVFGKVVGALGGAGQFEYQIVGSPTLTTTSGPGTCTVRIQGLAVQVTDVGEPVYDLAVAVKVSWPGGGDELNKKTTQSGTVSWSNEEVDTVATSCSSLSGQTASIVIAGGAASTSATIP
jgi:pilus assembly protein Flp/PilA